ncbi:MAG TPA: DUF6640 family protein [Terriglobia bacterium]|nr:DUF6640 family protein [Terriglobia bacterium]
MTRIKLGKFLLTFVLVLQAESGFFLDWRNNHLLNPLWVPHARFHGALLLFFLAGVSATGVWLLWRKSREPEVAVKAAALISASFWTPFFYITFLLPSSSPWAGSPKPVPRIAGHVFYPNIATAGVFLLLTGMAWVLCCGKTGALPKGSSGQVH